MAWTWLWLSFAALHLVGASTHAEKHRHQLRGQTTSVTAENPECSYWLDDIKHQGVAAFNSKTDYHVYRNVKDFGARGDGETDDTVAINKAISDGGRIGPTDGNQSSTTLGVVYFPPGEYKVSSSIIDYYYTQIIGNPKCPPVLKATANFTGLGVIDGDQYGKNGLGFSPATILFYRQVRNFVIDLTNIPANTSATGIHWPTAQATSLQNIVFKMSKEHGTQHQGVFIEGGSAGFISDLTFYGGLNGLHIGNQQYTLRNLKFHNSVAAINQLYSWGFTYVGLEIYGCTVGINMTAETPKHQTIASIVVIDSIIKNTDIGFTSVRGKDDNTSKPPAAGSLILENVELTSVLRAVVGYKNETHLAGTSGTKHIDAWAQGHKYDPDGPTVITSNIRPNSRPSSLLGKGQNFFGTSKRQYEEFSSQQIVSARSHGAKGDGKTDDTSALQSAINEAASANKLLFVDAGTYRVTKTVSIPAGALITGEGYAVIMSSGPFFADMKSPQPVVQVGKSGESGRVELSNLILSTQSDAAAGTGQGGAILLEWNLAASAENPSLVWDVHTRLGGTTGSNQQGDVCAKMPSSKYTTASQIPHLDRCTVAFASVHVTKEASGIYFENVWLWTADHDIDYTPAKRSDIAVFAGRGFLIESEAGNIWLYGTASEHHVLYQYQLSGTKNIFMGQIQTETAYFQPHPQAPIPFTSEKAYNDPEFTNAEYRINSTTTAPNSNGWGLRVIDSPGETSILAYGVGLYSFFQNWNTSCSQIGAGAVCQSHILEIDGQSHLSIYDLHTVGTRQPVLLNGKGTANYSQNDANFTTEIAVFRTEQ